MHYNDLKRIKKRAKIYIALIIHNYYVHKMSDVRESCFFFPFKSLHTITVNEIVTVIILQPETLLLSTLTL